MRKPEDKVWWRSHGKDNFQQWTSAGDMMMMMIERRQNIAMTRVKMWVTTYSPSYNVLMRMNTFCYSITPQLQDMAVSWNVDSLYKLEHIENFIFNKISRFQSDPEK